MLLRALIAAGIALLLVGPAAADECSQNLDTINEALAKPKSIKMIKADMGGSETILKAVGMFVEQAEADQKAGKEKACVTRLVAAKKILNID